MSWPKYSEEIVAALPDYMPPKDPNAKRRITLCVSGRFAKLLAANPENVRLLVSDADGIGYGERAKWIGEVTVAQWDGEDAVEREWRWYNG
jgi:hypothetical protein